MTEQIQQEQERPQAAAGPPVYVYGIVPADVEVSETAAGVGDPPAPVHLARWAAVGALISDVDASQPLGRPEDLLAHQRLLDAVAGQTPVLPVRFGAVLTGVDSVIAELLKPNSDGFTAALDEMDGRVQFVIKGRYAADTVLREVLAEDPEAQRLRVEIASVGSPAAARDASIRLGELVSAAITRKREADSHLVASLTAPVCVASSARPASDELDAVHLAVLIDKDRQPDLEAALDDLVRDWLDRVELRLLGPMAPYDFVVAGRPEGG